MADREYYTTSTSFIEFEKSTGYVGVASRAMPEPITAVVIEASMGLDANDRFVEFFWVKAVDATDTAEPQPIMSTYTFHHISQLCGALFSACDQIVKRETRLDGQFTAYFNTLAKQLDPELPKGPQGGLVCTVEGYGNRGVRVKFCCFDSPDHPVAAFQGSILPQEMHTLARGFREMVDWRNLTKELVHEEKLARAATKGQTRRVAADAAPAATASSARTP